MNLCASVRCCSSGEPPWTAPSDGDKPFDAARLPATDGKGILFLDELTSAPQMVQDRLLAARARPQAGRITCQTVHRHRCRNPASERGVHFAMPRPLRNRFIHANARSRFYDGHVGVKSNRIRHEIMAFLASEGATLPTGKADDNGGPVPDLCASRPWLG